MVPIVGSDDTNKVRLGLYQVLNKTTTAIESLDTVTPKKHIEDMNQRYIELQSRHEILKTELKDKNLEVLTLTNKFTTENTVLNNLILENNKKIEDLTNYVTSLLKNISPELMNNSPLEEEQKKQESIKSISLIIEFINQNRSTFEPNSFPAA